MHHFSFLFYDISKYRQHTDPNGRYDQNEIKRNKGLNYFKQNCPLFRFALQYLPQGLSGKKYVKRKQLQLKW